MQDELVDEEDCPCFYGGSCPTDYKHRLENKLCDYPLHHYKDCNCKINLFRRNGHIMHNCWSCISTDDMHSYDPIQRSVTHLKILDWN